MYRLVSVILTLCLTACSATSGEDRPDGPLVVSAASSLTNVMERLVRAYEREADTRVELNLAASSTLAAQLIAGAPVDLFISADLFQMDRVAAAGVIRLETRVELLSNQLVVVAPADATMQVTSPASFLEPDFGRIAIADPQGVPAGVYARTYLESIGLWASLQDRLVPTRNVRAALATVQAGNVDAGIVYRTDVPSAPGVTVVFEVPVAEGPAIAYPAALTTRATHTASAERLLAYLQGPEASGVFEAAGFIIP
jgi:molybdate transport system substrate-binding protein